MLILPTSLCCVPLCNGDSCYHHELKFHHLPGHEKDTKLREEWLVKIRRDKSPDFKIPKQMRVMMSIKVNQKLAQPLTKCNQKFSSSRHSYWLCKKSYRKVEMKRKQRKKK
ncbi:unnamed protein product [Pocillopora meandrina]|uniref:THAP-type domain-containing protein n=1 Tax=Pocillopora meandrina TaxID=46732 RepID=A0AAU9X1H3_9CNID|nr:unnamed protein product [Pocillopora meandrina]